ncbi:putative sodium-coupled neutral amino acid transporter 6 [Saccoglossus kowalevskii]|uniref:Probable sodium-coupled neutral amino acid transporter 6-like n=1 Tax=Saccoglossus kowalevskii TaxID=10224 RepID=A0ABM0GQP8_SACKO|nr:PREDICTED: probable sodium-coupled neutral amino acid transporter 6-like [Saccoglossus kowalevskii]
MATSVNDDFRDVTASLISSDSDQDVSKAHDEDKFKPRKASFGLSVFNLMNAVLGSGILGLSYAMSESGIVLFSILLVTVAMVAAYSLHLLLKMCAVTQVKSYEDIGQIALKRTGKFLAAFAILLQNIGAMSSYLFIVKNELPHVIRTFMKAPPHVDGWYLNGDYLVLLMVLIIITPLALLPNIGFLGYTSGFSVLCMVFFTTVVILKKFSFPCPIPTEDWSNVTATNLTQEYLLSNSTWVSPAVVTIATAFVPTTSTNSTPSDDGDCEPKLFSLSLNTAYAVPTMAFSFVCHTAVLPIYEEIKRPSKARMQSVVNITILICFTLYLLSALFGYLTFYGNVSTELLEGYTLYNRHDILMLIVRLAVLFSVTLTVPLLHFPARKALTVLIAGNKPFSCLRHCLLTAFLITLITVLALFVPDIKEVFGFAGATSSTALVFILPAIFYLRIGKEPFKSREKIMALCLFILGICVFLLSLTLIVIGWATG